MTTLPREVTLRYQGPLEKQGKILKGSWKKYWFLLQDDQLIYYKEDGKSSKSSGRRTSSSSSQGEILLNQVQTIKECINVNHGHAFEINTKSRTHVLAGSLSGRQLAKILNMVYRHDGRAETSESRSAWMKVLTEAMTLKNRNSSISEAGEPKSSCKSIGEVEEEDDGNYDSMDFNKDNSNSTQKPKSIADIQISVTGEARCYSEVFDDNYSPVFDAQPPVPEYDDDDTYDEVENAIGREIVHIRESAVSQSIPAYAETPSQIGSPNHSTTEDSNQSEGSSVPSRGSYSYVQMRKKTSIDYRKPAKSPVANEEYSDVTCKDVNEELEYSETCDEVTVITSNRTSSRSSETVNVNKSYAKVIPKALRGQTSNEIESNNNKVKPGDEDYDDVCIPSYGEMADGEMQDEYDDVSEYVKKTFVSHPDLPNPRLELTVASAFDKIRLFLAEHRGPNEVYKISDDIRLDGYAIDNLTKLLNELDIKNSNINNSKSKRMTIADDLVRKGKPPVAEKRVQSTHL